MADTTTLAFEVLGKDIFTISQEEMGLISKLALLKMYTEDLDKVFKMLNDGIENPIKRYRKLLNLTQEKLATIADLRISTLQKLEAKVNNFGNIRGITISKLANAININTDMLFQQLDDYDKRLSYIKDLKEEGIDTKYIQKYNLCIDLINSGVSNDFPVASSIIKSYTDLYIKVEDYLEDIK